MNPLQSIDHTSKVILAVRLLGGSYSPTRIKLPCGRSLRLLGENIWELDHNFEVSLPGESPEALAAKIRKLLVRHDDFLLTTPKKASKFSTKQQ